MFSLKVFPSSTITLPAPSSNLPKNFLSNKTADNAINIHTITYNKHCNPLICLEMPLCIIDLQPLVCAPTTSVTSFMRTK